MPSPDVMQALIDDLAPVSPPADVENKDEVGK
jgi:hypothetical protein